MRPRPPQDAHAACDELGIAASAYPTKPADPNAQVQSPWVRHDGPALTAWLSLDLHDPRVAGERGAQCWRAAVAYQRHWQSLVPARPLGGAGRVERPAAAERAARHGAHGAGEHGPGAQPHCLHALQASAPVPPHSDRPPAAAAGFCRRERRSRAAVVRLCTLCPFVHPLPMKTCACTAAATPCRCLASRPAGEWPAAMPVPPCLTGAAEPTDAHDASPPPTLATFATAV